MTETISKVFAITGTFHGSIVIAPTEGLARKAFHKKYNGESIISVSCITTRKQTPFKII